MSQMQQSLADSMADSFEESPPQNDQKAAPGDCLGDSRGKQRNFMYLVATFLFLQTFVQLLLDQLAINGFIGKGILQEFYIADAISIVMLVLFGLIMVSTVVLSKLMRVNSFLLVFFFSFSWSFINYMIFVYSKVDDADILEDLVLVYRCLLYRIFIVQFAFLFTILIFQVYFNLILGFILIGVFYALATIFLAENTTLFPMMLLEMGNFLYVFDIFLMLIIAFYYYFQTWICVTKRRFYYSAQYWGNGFVDFMTDWLWIFWYNLFLYKEPQAGRVVTKQEVRVMGETQQIQKETVKKQEEEDFY